jgi:hypothetical protein
MSHETQWKSARPMPRLIFVLFATAFVSSSLWYEAADRNVTEQKLFSA